MLKRIALLLTIMLCLAGVAFSEALVTAELPADTADITSFALDASFSAEKTGYQTVGWYVTAPSGAAFDTFIGKYRDSLAAQGFVLTREVHPSGLDAVYYFFDHPDSRLTSARMNGIEFDLFLCGEKNGSRMAMVLGVVPGINLTEPAPEESWESLFGEEEPTWESVLDIPEEEPAPTIDPSAKNVIPSFESFAKEAILDIQTNGGRTTCTVSMEDFSALIEYTMVLEHDYGVSGQDGGETEYGLPLYLWLEDYEGDLEPDKCSIVLENGEKDIIGGYVFFALDEKDGRITVTVWYAQGMTPADTGDRWDGAVLAGEELAAIQQMFSMTGKANQAYPFKNDAIAKDMAFKLKKDVSEITWADVWDYSELGVIMPTNPDLSDVENMSLFRFSIYPMTSETIDLSCLKNSEYLDVLNLIDGRYTGFDTVAKLEWIDQISLYAKSISDISWMKDMELLRFVSIQDCSVTDFSALGTLPRLKQVYLEISLSSDVSFLYGKGLSFGKTFGSPECSFDEWYEKNWGVPGQAAAATARPAALAQGTPTVENGGVRVSTPVEITSSEVTSDSVVVQDLYSYMKNKMSFGSITKNKKGQSDRGFSGDKKVYDLICEYVECVTSGNYNLRLVDSYYHNFNHPHIGNVIHFSFALDYTGTGNVHGEKPEMFGKDGVCGDVVITGFFEYSSFDGHIYAANGLEFGDLGLRVGGETESISLPGESLTTDLYRLSDGSYQTGDGRFHVQVGEAAVYRDGKMYTTDATLYRNQGDNREELRIYNFYRNESIIMTIPYNSVITGDILDRSVFGNDDDDNGYDKYMNSMEDFLSWRFSDRLLGVCHDSDYFLCYQDDHNEFDDAVARVMYWDKAADVAVFYICATFDSAPYEYEAVAAVSLGGTPRGTNADEVFNMQAGKTLDITFSGTEYMPSYELFTWEILEGSSLIELTGTRSQTCTVKAYAPGVVRLKITYEYGAKGSNILTGNEETKFMSKTREYVINISPK